MGAERETAVHSYDTAYALSEIESKTYLRIDSQQVYDNVRAIRQLMCVHSLIL